MPHAATAQKRLKRSAYHDPDVYAWLRERAQREDRAIDWVIRQILRAAMDAEISHEGGSAS